MSIKCMTRVWEHSRMKGSALLLELAIADHAHDDGSGAWPSQETLAKKTRLSVRQVRRLLDVLVDAGELALEERTGATAMLTILTGADKMSALHAAADDRPPRTDPADARPECPPTPDTATSAESSSTVLNASMNASRAAGCVDDEDHAFWGRTITDFLATERALGREPSDEELRLFRDHRTAHVAAV